MNEQAQSAEARLHALERRVVRAIALGVAVLAGLAGCIALSARQASDQVVRAPRIELVDSKGQVRVVIDAEFQGPELAGLEIKGQNGDLDSVLILAGKYPTTAGTSEHTAGIWMESDTASHDDIGPCAHMIASERGANALLGYDEGGIVDLGAAKSGATVCVGSSEDEEREEGGTTILGLKRIPLITLSAEDGAPSLRIQDAKGVTQFEKP
jgi:hypothetical protein